MLVRKMGNHKTSKKGYLFGFSVRPW